MFALIRESDGALIAYRHTYDEAIAYCDFHVGILGEEPMRILEEVGKADAA